MIRTLAIALALATLSLTGCKTKPSDEACREAIANIRKLTGKVDVGANPKAAIRSCRGNSSKESVDCVNAAKTLEELQKCEGAVGEEYFKQEAEAEKKRHEKADQEAGKKSGEEEVDNDLDDSDDEGGW